MQQRSAPMQSTTTTAKHPVLNDLYLVGCKVMPNWYHGVRAATTRDSWGVPKVAAQTGTSTPCRSKH